MKIIKLINFERFRLWVVPNNQYWFTRKIFKPLGFIAHIGRIRISCTIIKSKMILFNPMTLTKINIG